MLTVLTNAGSLTAQDRPADGDRERGSAIAAKGETSQPGYARRHALVIGIDDDQDPIYPDLEYAVADALEGWASDPERVGEDDLLVFFFAGHGVTRKVGSRGSRGYLVPVDGGTDRRDQPRWGSLLDMTDLESESELIPAKHVLFILDCCFGGLAVSRTAGPVAAEGSPVEPGRS